MKSKKIFCLVSLCLCLSCSPAVSEETGPKDELGVSYQEEDLKKDNVFDYYYTNPNPWEDDGWHDNADPIEIDTKFPEHCVIDRDNPAELPLYIRWNPSKFSSAYSEDLQPVLSWKADCYSISYDDFSVVTYYTSEGNFQTLPKYNEETYSYSRLDFPSKNTYYIEYHYLTTIFVDFSRFYSEDIKKGDFYFSIGICRMNKESLRFVKRQQKKKENMHINYSEFWSNSIQFSVVYKETSENKSKVNVSLAKSKRYH